MIVLIDGVRYQLNSPQSESELENAIRENHKDVFGPDSFYFDVKSKIKSRAGVGSIPDGYIILFDPNPKWCILEVELASHPIYDHLIPQLTKFNRGIEDSRTRKKLVDIFYSTINEDELLKARLKKKIKSGEVYKFVSDLISEDPLIIVAIDERTDEVEEALRDIRGEVRILEFRTFRREALSDKLNAYLFEPIFPPGGPTEVVTAAKASIRYQPSGKKRTIIHAMFALFDEKDVDTITYDECEALAKQVKPDTKFGKTHFTWYKNKYRELRSGGLPKGLKLHNKYKQILFTAEVIGNRKINFGGQIYNSPSRAAVAAIQSTGSPRKTEDGWKWWKFIDPETGEEKLIDELRKK